MNLAAEIAAAHAKNEAALASQIITPQLDIEAELFNRWIAFCRERGVRHLPGSPAVVAVFIHWLHANHTPQDIILKSLESISAAHSNSNLADPVPCAAPRQAVLDVMKLDPPRWNKSEQLLWAALPPEVQAVISRRDKQTSTLIRRLQNENAELKKQLSEKDIKDGTSDPQRP